MEWYQGDLQKAIAAEDWPKVKQEAISLGRGVVIVSTSGGSTVYITSISPSVDVGMVF